MHRESAKRLLAERNADLRAAIAVAAKNGPVKGNLLTTVNARIDGNFAKLMTLPPEDRRSLMASGSRDSGAR